MPDDEKHANVNGNRKLLKKKYQVSALDGGAQKDIAKNDMRVLIFESDDEEGLPLSSVLKIKHQESDSADGSIQEQSDKKEFMGNKINEAQDEGDQITGIKRTIEGCEIERGVGCVRHDSEETPKKRVTESQCGRVENDLKVDVQDEENFVVEARIDNTSKSELVKDQPINNLYNDKAFVQSSHENVVKTKKHKKHAKERHTTELGNDSKIDVQEENIQVKEAVNNDFNQEVLVKDNTVDNMSIDK
ncbi:hypothetical protein FRX31_004375 [Thalictrum thalictroides]|uniref:Uncharacterized protein n=1 Tax=Thalictrum thalictroides TaxID=46969 RepID=A0A7J6XAS8_THATH|nr:hypothetical protein FRX31_004375 [Thalictrum thalictroides]